LRYSNQKPTPALTNQQITCVVLRTNFQEFSICLGDDKQIRNRGSLRNVNSQHV